MQAEEDESRPWMAGNSTINLPLTIGIMKVEL
jgi:hypothetical protein